MLVDIIIKYIVVKKPEFGELAQKVFMKSIESVGGLKKTSRIQKSNLVTELAKLAYKKLKEEGKVRIRRGNKTRREPCKRSI